jgi:hypothetical protein
VYTGTLGYSSQSGFCEATIYLDINPDDPPMMQAFGFESETGTRIYGPGWYPLGVFINDDNGSVKIYGSNFQGESYRLIVVE